VYYIILYLSILYCLNNIRIYIRICTYMYVYIRICTYMYVYIRIYTYIYVYVHKYIYICVYMYIFEYIYWKNALSVAYRVAKIRRMP